MITLLLGVFIGSAVGLVFMSVVASGACDSAYARGRRDERAEALARELWESESGSYGGSE